QQALVHTEATARHLARPGADGFAEPRRNAIAAPPGAPSASAPVVAVVATILIGLLGGEAAGVSVVGHLPPGLPHLTPPVLDPKILWELAPGCATTYVSAFGGGHRSRRGLGELLRTCDRWRARLAAAGSP